jgi:hypothetical protein
MKVDNRGRRTQEQAWSKICAAVAYSVASAGVEDTEKALAQVSEFLAQNADCADLAASFLRCSKKFLLTHRPHMTKSSSQEDRDMTTTEQTQSQERNNDAPVARGLAEIDNDLQACRAKRDELIQRIGDIDARIMDLQDEAQERITGHKKRGRKRHQSGLHSTVGEA